LNRTKDLRHYDELVDKNLASLNSLFADLSKKSVITQIARLNDENKNIIEKLITGGKSKRPSDKSFHNNPNNSSPALNEQTKATGPTTNACF
jgi:hypothetical protein